MIDIDQIRYAADGTAWKTPAMRGYVKKTALDADTYGEGAFKLTFVKANGTAYDFFWDNGTGTSSSSLTLDRELLGHILNSNWQQGTAADYEAARGGTGTW